MKKIKYLIPFILTAIFFLSVTNVKSQAGVWTRIDSTNKILRNGIGSGSTFSVSLNAVDKGIDTLNQSARKHYIQQTTVKQKLDTINQTLRSLKLNVDSIKNTKIVEYSREFLANTITYSIAGAVMIGTNTVNSFSINLGSGYYSLQSISIIDFSGVITGGYNVFFQDSISPQTDNVAINQATNYYKRNLIYRYDLTSNAINSTGRTFFPVSGVYGNNSITSAEPLYTGIVYWLITVVTTGANTAQPKTLRCQFKKV